MTEIWT